MQNARRIKQNIYHSVQNKYDINTNINLLINL